MKPKNIYTIIPLFILFVVFFFIYLKFYDEEENNAGIQFEKYETSCGKYKKGEVDINAIKILVDIADDKCKLDLGLSDKTTLADNAGMLFTFDRPGNYGFWMKDMNFPLDIVWIDDNFKIIGIEKSLATSTYPKPYGQKYFAKYVLEISANYSDKNNIKVGDSIIFTQN